MDYYIKKNDAVSLLMKEAKSHELSFSAEAYERAANIVACMPNEDVQPVKHGRWLPSTSYITAAYGTIHCQICSECEADLMEDNDYNYDFCPVCGARMDGDTNG